jgi:SAM-dependent methyltransferase
MQGRNPVTQAYGRVFARVYDRRWTAFAQRIAPELLDLYENSTLAPENKRVLDLCCGTGQVARYFLDHGYQVTGIDLSQAMLEIARERCRDYVESGQVRFIQADASDFTLEEHVGLAISTYDAMNHLESFEALGRCFQRVRQAIEDGGLFIFDLNTPAGLRRWNSITVEDAEDAMIVTRGIYDGSGDRAWTRVSGFVEAEDGRYERFDETVYNTVYALENVRTLLLEVGFDSVYFARAQDLSLPLSDPEEERRVFVVANA